jgi:hypothetical protein
MIFMAFPFPNESGKRVCARQFGSVNGGTSASGFSASGYGGVIGSGYASVTVPALHHASYAEGNNQ